MKKQKKIIKETKNGEKSFDKKGFTKYFSYELTTLITKLLGQNTQDLRKSLDKIKQGKIILSEDERNSTNKNKNDELNNMLSVIDRIYQFFKYKFLPGEQSDELSLPKWVNINILSTVTNAKNEGLKTNVDGREITLNNTQSLLKDLGIGLLERHEFEKGTTILLMMQKQL